MANYFSTNDIIASASTALEEINKELSGVSNASLFNESVSKAIHSAISNGKSSAQHWKAINPQSTQYQYHEKFPVALFENMDKELLVSLEKMGIHIFLNELKTATIKVTYRW